MRVWASLLLAICIASPVPANAAFLATQSSLKLNHTVGAPDEAKRFLRREPEFAKLLAEPKSKTTTVLHYDEKLKALLDQVTKEGNETIKWTSDDVAWGEPDNWDFPCEVDHHYFDDCDSFTLWKLRRLMELGLPASPLMMALTFVETGEYHAVLIVATDAGDFVLDNRFSHVQTVEQAQAAGYVFDERVSSGDDLGGSWVTFARPHQPKPFHPLAPLVKTPKGPPMCVDKLLLKKK